MSEQFGISSSLVYAWRKQLVTRASEVFEDRRQVESRGAQGLQTLTKIYLLSIWFIAALKQFRKRVSDVKEKTAVAAESAVAVARTMREFVIVATEYGIESVEILAWKRVRLLFNAH